MTHKCIKVDTREKRVGIITLDRLKVLNTVNKELIAEPVGAAEAFVADDRIGLHRGPGTGVILGINLLCGLRVGGVQPGILKKLREGARYKRIPPPNKYSLHLGLAQRQVVSRYLVRSPYFSCQAFRQQRYSQPS